MLINSLINLTNSFTHEHQVGNIIIHFSDEKTGMDRLLNLPNHLNGRGRNTS